MDFVDSMDSMDSINSMEFMNSMDSMEALDCMDSMEFYGFNGIMESCSMEFGSVAKCISFKTKCNMFISLMFTCFS